MTMAKEIWCGNCRRWKTPIGAKAIRDKGGRIRCRRCATCVKLKEDAAIQTEEIK